MNENVVTFASMHIEHRHWQGEHKRWRGDVRRWREQDQEALDVLAALQRQILRKHDAAIEAHVRTFEESEDQLQDHEHSMAGYTTTGESPSLQEEWCKNHQGQTERHDQQRRAHKHFEKQHRSVMAQLAALTKTVNSTLEPADS